MKFGESERRQERICQPPWSELDRFAAVLRIDVAVLRQDVRSAADYAVNAVAIRREDRKAAADGKRIVTDLIPNAERALRRISRLDAVQVERSTVPRTAVAESLTEAVIRKAAELSASLSILLEQIDYPRLPAGGGSDQDRLAVTFDRSPRASMDAPHKPAGTGWQVGPIREFRRRCMERPRIPGVHE
jgi:hypothetical protein